MHAIELRAEVRKDMSKGGAGRLRRSGLVPGVLYGREVGNISLVIPVKDLERVLDTAGQSALVKVLLGSGDRPEEYTSLVREVQRHPLRREPIHVDLYQVSMEQRLQTVAPVELVGEAPGVKNGGILQHGVREIEVECLPADIPEALKADVSGLEIGDKLTIGDILPPPGVKIVSDGDGLVATIVPPRLAVEEEPGVEEPGEPEEIKKANEEEGEEE